MPLDILNIVWSFSANICRASRATFLVRMVVPLKRPASIRETSTELTGTMTKSLGRQAAMGIPGQCPRNCISMALTSLLSMAGAPRMVIRLLLKWAMDSRPLITWPSYRVLE